MNHPVNYPQGLSVFVRCGLVLSLAVLSAYAAPLTSTLGPTYPVIEPDILELLKTHAMESRTQTQEKLRQSQQRLQQHAVQPKGMDLPQATHSKTVKIAVSADAARVIGDDFQRRWLMINANQTDEVKLAHVLLRDEKPLVTQTPSEHLIRVILVDGNVEKTAKSLQSRVWFDQGGRLVEKFGITATPALIKMTAQGIYVTQAPVHTLLKNSSTVSELKQINRKELP